MNTLVIDQSSAEMLLSKLATDAGRACQENVRLYGEFIAKSMHAQSSRCIAAVEELIAAAKDAQVLASEACRGPDGPARRDAIARRDRLAAAIAMRNIAA